MNSWYPFPGPQFEFCSRGEFEVLFGGAAGPGKTDCLIMEATRDVQHPTYSGILFRRTYPQLQEIVDRCWRWYPKIGGQYRATEHRWYFPSGAKVTLSHMQHEADMYNHQGKERLTALRLIADLAVAKHSEQTVNVNKTEGPSIGLPPARQDPAKLISIEGKKASNE